MFVREKTINGYTYLYLVESVREGARTKQRIIKNLGRKDAVLASGELDRLGGLGRPLRRAGARAVAGRRTATPTGSPAAASARRCCSAACGRTPACRGGARRAACRPRLRVPGRARGVRRHPAPADGLRLRPGLREVDGRLRHPRQRRPGSAPLLPRHGLAGRGAARGRAGRCHAVRPTLREGPDRGANWSRGGATCSASSASCSWTRRPCPSSVPVGRRSAGAATPRTIVPS